MAEAVALDVLLTHETAGYVIDIADPAGCITTAMLPTNLILDSTLR